MQFFVWHCALPGSCKCAKWWLSIKSLGGGKSISWLEVFFSIETGSFYEGSSSLNRAWDEDKINGEEFLLLNPNNLPYYYLAPLYLDEHPFSQD